MKLYVKKCDIDMLLEDRQIILGGINPYVVIKLIGDNEVVTE